MWKKQSPNYNFSRRKRDKRKEKQSGSKGRQSSDCNPATHCFAFSIAATTLFLSNLSQERCNTHDTGRIDLTDPVNRLPPSDSPWLNVHQIQEQAWRNSTAQLP
jgi:hypothetical protein